LASHGWLSGLLDAIVNAEQTDQTPMPERAQTAWHAVIFIDPDALGGLGSRSVAGWGPDVAGPHFASVVTGRGNNRPR
jgi:hypothetical protein